MPRGLLSALIVGCALAAGCHTPVGNYFANRARDFGECFRVQVTAPGGLGVHVRAAGLMDAGLFGGVAHPPVGASWTYGRGFVFGAGEVWGDATVFWPLTTLDELGHGIPEMGGWGHYSTHGEQLPLAPRRRGEREFSIEHRCGWLLPCVLSQVKTDREFRWLWAHSADRAVRWARVHAFDVEVGAYALFVGATVGFSPGEFLDFLLGWFGLDIAGDDRVLPGPEAPPGG